MLALGQNNAFCPTTTNVVDLGYSNGYNLLVFASTCAPRRLEMSAGKFRF